MTDWPPALTLETEPVLKLFTGENFYSSPDAALREAVLNAIDAIGRRRDTDQGLQAEISVIFDRTAQTIEISDNGIGMSRDDLGGLFTKVGASAAQLAEGTDYKAVGEFGIGALSYFLICEEYEIETHRDGSDPIGLVFTKEMLNGKTRATEKAPSRTEIGTTLTLKVTTPENLELCIKRFPHWLRSVEGLSGRVLPEENDLAQGGLTRAVRSVEPDVAPEWMEGTQIGPPEDLSVWDRYDGRGQVDVLYRGVFVERLTIDNLWGLEGAIHVDPKHFRPMLNREGFVGDTLKGEVSPFLQKAHPLVLERAAECIHDLLEANDDWSNSRVITLWLAVPRRAEYAAAVEKWDAEFKSRKAFTLLGQRGESAISIDEIIRRQPEQIYLAPDQDDPNAPLVRQAIRVLRGQGKMVIRGLQRDGGYLQNAPVASQFSSWLLPNSFREELPEIVHVQNVAEGLIRQDSLAEVYFSNPIVKLVEIGADSVPFIAIGNEVWINIETDAGRQILEEVCARNEGHIGLWVACMMHAPGDRSLNQVGNLIRSHNPEVERLGLVRRQYLRSLLS